MPLHVVGRDDTWYLDIFDNLVLVDGLRCLSRAWRSAFRCLEDHVQLVGLSDATVDERIRAFMELFKDCVAGRHDVVPCTKIISVMAAAHDSDCTKCAARVELPSLVQLRVLSFEFSASHPDAILFALKLKQVVWNCASTV